ncbi:hypothetical protein E4U17_001505 [Claviceps sp. LM77 group G4]|nr:hypothetical protein E4U17_001505 [Claviceps sp. LM77 group G4]
MISTGFEKQQQYTQQLKSKLDDFLEDRIAFQMTLVGIAQHGISSDIPGDVNRVRSGGLNTIKPAFPAREPHPSSYRTEAINEMNPFIW